MGSALHVIRLISGTSEYTIVILHEVRPKRCDTLSRVSLLFPNTGMFLYSAVIASYSSRYCHTTSIARARAHTHTHVLSLCVCFWVGCLLCVAVSCNFLISHTVNVTYSPILSSVPILPQYSTSDCLKKVQYLLNSYSSPWWNEFHPPVILIISPGLIKLASVSQRERVMEAVLSAMIKWANRWQSFVSVTTPSQIVSQQRGQVEATHLFRVQ